MEDVLEDDAFETKEGYRMALIGAYRLAASEKLWGQDLSWGFMSVLGRNYNPTYLPTKYSRVITDGNFSSSYVKPVIAGIWEQGYNVIANCNNILKNIEHTDKSFFEYDWERDMIMAEARALRALVHFEMMRIFVPAPITGYSGKAIPYVRDYPVISPPYHTMEEVFQFVIEDLTFAQKNLRRADVDVLYGENSMTYMYTTLFYGIQNLLDNGKRGNGNGFFSFRGFRMNYWGVSALLARVYSYKRDNATAVQYIDALLEEFEGRQDIGWGFNQYNSNPNQIDGKRIPEPLISFWNTEEYTIYETTVASLANSFRIISLNALFGLQDIKEDYRYIGYYNTGTQRYRVWDRPNDPAYPSQPTGSIMRYSGPLLPVLELPELYYIRCEYLAEQGKLEEAIAMLKVVKDNRNITSSIQANNIDEFMEVLINDLTRDFLTRGQTWHYLKKLNWKKMYNGTNVPWEVPDDWFVLPLPDSEVNYIN